MEQVINNKYHQDGITICNVSIIPDVRFFTLYAFYYLNSSLYPDFFDKNKLSNDQKMLLEDMNSQKKNVDPSELEKWMTFLKKHPYHLWHYIYYTSFIKMNPFFEIDFTDEMPHVSNNSHISHMTDFNKILKDFYYSCNIDDLFFAKYKNILLKCFDIYDEDKIKKTTNAMFEYIRVKKSEFDSYKINIIPIPFEEEYHSYAAPHKNMMYFFESIGSQNGGIAIHEYLHLFINPTVEAIDDIEKYEIIKVFERNKNTGYVVTDYSCPYSYITECFVRAFDYKIWLKLIPGTEFNFQVLKENGLELVEDIFNGLEEYEKNASLSIEKFIRGFVNDYKLK